MVIKPIKQITNMDCGVTALSMLLGMDYGDVVAVTTELFPHALARGMYATELQRVSKELGHPLKAKRTFHEEDTGILIVNLPEKDYHALVLFQGVLINPADGCIWDYETYLKKATAIPRRLLVLHPPAVL